MNAPKSEVYGGELELIWKAAPELTITQEGIPPAIPLEFCYLGWQESLSLLAYLVEPEIPDGA